MTAFNLEDADRVTTVGASDITMRIWKELEAAGEQGLTRDEVLERVGPHINRGYAKRRYLRARLRERQEISALARTRPRADISWETTELEPALRYIITKTLANMRRYKSVIQHPDSRYTAGRIPRHRDPSIIDMTGDRTRVHMNSVQALRILEPALTRLQASAHAQLNTQEKQALFRLVELHKEMLRGQR